MATKGPAGGHQVGLPLQCRLELSGSACGMVDWDCGFLFKKGPELQSLGYYTTQPAWVSLLEFDGKSGNMGYQVQCYDLLGPFMNKMTVVFKWVTPFDNMRSSDILGSSA